MVKQKVTADVRSLADRYFCEQCDRLGLPRPHAIAPISRCSGKPLKAPRHAFRPREINPELVAKDTADGLAFEREMMAAIAPGEPAPRMGLEAILKAYGDPE